MSVWHEVVNRFGGSETPELFEMVVNVLVSIEALDALVFFSAALGPARMRELIQASPATDLLLPLTTALEWELGLQPRVAREVEEVARDIRLDLARLREAGAGVVSSDETAVEPERQDG